MGQFSLAFERGVCSCPGSATDALGFWGIDYFSSVCNADRCGQFSLAFASVRVAHATEIKSIAG